MDEPNGRNDRVYSAMNCMNCYYRGVFNACANPRAIQGLEFFSKPIEDCYKPWNADMDEDIRDKYERRQKR
jgi:hypothetical protein